MKNLTALILFACSFAAHAQTPASAEQNIIVSQTQAGNPLVLVNEQQTAMGAFILEPDKIEKVDVLKGEKATAKYGDKAKEGAVIITLKERAELIRLPKVYTHFKVPAAQQQLKVAINGKIVQKPDLLLVELASVKAVEVATANNPFAEGGEEKYLNLVTR